MFAQEGPEELDDGLVAVVALHSEFQSRPKDGAGDCGGA